MKALLMAVLICLTFNAFAFASDACPVKRPGELPLMPDGAVATEKEMYRAQLVAEKYLLQAQVYIECGVMNRRQHLALGSRLEGFSQVYNEEVVEFQVRTNIIAEK